MSSNELDKIKNIKNFALEVRKNILEMAVSAGASSAHFGGALSITEIVSTLLNKEEWYDIFKKLTYWELELEESGDQGVEQILAMQKSEANAQFFRFVKNHYKDWIQGKDAPLMSHNLIRKKVIPRLAHTKHIKH